MIGRLLVHHCLNIVVDLFVIKAAFPTSSLFPLKGQYLVARQCLYVYVHNYITTFLNIVWASKHVDKFCIVRNLPYKKALLYDTIIKTLDINISKFKVAMFVAKDTYSDMLTQVLSPLVEQNHCYSTYLCPFQVEDNVTVILLSEIVWDKFRPNTGCFEPLLLHFPDYSKGIITHTQSSASVMNNSHHTACIMMTHAWQMRCEMWDLYLWFRSNT